MNNRDFFKEIITFVANVHASTHTMKKGANADEVTPLQHSVLSYLFFEQGVTTSQIADCLNISLPNTSRELKKLFKQDLLIKEPCLDDKRKFSISLSEKGMELMLITFQRMEDNFWQENGDFTDAEKQEIITAARLLNEKVFATN